MERKKNGKIKLSFHRCDKTLRSYSRTKDTKSGQNKNKSFKIKTKLKIYLRIRSIKPNKSSLFFGVYVCVCFKKKLNSNEKKNE